MSTPSQMLSIESPSHMKKPNEVKTSFGKLERELEIITQKAYFFFTEPNSSRASFAWSLFMAVLVILISLFYILSTCDGPNHYTGRKNMASLPSLPSEKTYELIFNILWAPLLLDTFCRALMVLGVFTLHGTYEIADDFLDDKFKKCLHIFDFLSVLPFLFRVIYLQPHDVQINQFLGLSLRAFDLLSFSKILRLTKDINAVIAVRLALEKASPHLLIPLFFFVVMNIFYGVLLYFIEPCYNLNICPWKNLFDSSFYCVVTMTTTGYGNQVPKFLPGRGVASIIMLFGSLFMAMPLAIIGNEYESAWAELKEKLRQDELEEIANGVTEKLQTISADVSHGEDGPLKRSSTNLDDFMRRRKMLRKRLSQNKIESDSIKLANETVQSPLIDSMDNLSRALADVTNILKTSKKMNPSLLLLMCELRGWMAPLKWNIRQSIAELKESNDVEEDSRRLSMFRSNNTFSEQNVQNDRGSSFSPNANRVTPFSDAPERDDESEKKNESFASEETDKLNITFTPRKPITSSSVSPLPVTSGRSRKVANLKPGMSRDAHSFAIKMVKAAPDIHQKGNTEEFSRKMENALKNPNSIRTRLWMILEFPNSSKLAKTLQIFLLVLICVSVLMLYTQTVPSFGSYGEYSEMCGEVLHAYCPNKHDNTLDPGCFVHDENGPTLEKLNFYCEDPSCFGYGYNFGSSRGNVTCLGDIHPFQTAEELALNYRLPDFMCGRDEMHKIHDPCFRVECTVVPGAIDGNIVWIPFELFVNFMFTIEIVLRIFVADSLYKFLRDFLNVFDMLSVVPFYIDILQLIFISQPLNFAILSSSPRSIILNSMKAFKVFRLFKSTRHFGASKVLFETARKVMFQILGIMSLLLFIVLMFSLFLYEVEKGTPCYVGDEDCVVPEAQAYLYKPGQQVLINKIGNVSFFKTVLDSLWFSIVTQATVGYGDMYPITNLGMLLSIILMLFGAMYMAMPLTVAAATFWSVHQSYTNANKKKKKTQTLFDSSFFRRIQALETSLGTVSNMLQNFFEDIQSPISTEGNHSGKLSLLERCIQIESSLKAAFRNYDSDIQRLSVLVVSSREQKKETFR